MWHNANALVINISLKIVHGTLPKNEKIQTFIPCEKLCSLTCSPAVNKDVWLQTAQPRESETGLFEFFRHGKQDDRWFADVPRFRYNFKCNFNLELAGTLPHSARL